MLSRKDFKAIAEILKDFQNDLTVGAHQDLINSFSIMFKKENPRFDFDKFKTAATN